jgi:transposase
VPPWNETWILATQSKEGPVAKERRQFSRTFKLEALARFESAGNVEALARELGIRRELLYVWRRKFVASGADGLNNAGRPRPSGQSAQALSADQRTAELERRIGRQALEIDFLEGALRRIEASRQPSDGPGAMGSSPRSRR